ncbi:MAG: dTMP kinase, partial [Janthinobacterium sp.]
MTQHYQPRFITFEGIDGAGKSTHIGFVTDYLQQRGVSLVSSREPGGTSLGEKLRELLLHEKMHLETEALLMFASRREHIAQVIAPALARGEWVISDRFSDASFAYQ